MNTAPKHLSPEAKLWWRSLAQEYGIGDPGGRLLLQTACEAFDEMRRAQAILERDGLTFEDRFEQMKPNPAATMVRDARAAMLSALKALNLDVEPTRDGPGRPPGH